LRVLGRAELVITTSWGILLAEAFLAHIEEGCSGIRFYSLSETRVVYEFQDIFQDIPGLSLVREVEFCIELQLNTSPICRAPYHMAPIEMRELQTQFEELSAQGFI